MTQSGKDRVVIVGAGVVGLSCALGLLDAGLEIAVLDEDPATPPASWGNAGHIATEQVEPIASWAALRSAPRRLYSRGGALAFRPADIAQWLPWSLRYAAACRPARFARGVAALETLLADALPAWQRLTTRLAAPDLVDAAGHIVVWESATSAARGMAAWQAARIGTARIEPLAGADLAELGERLRRRLYGGVRFHLTGQVAEPARVLQQLRQAISDAGGNFYHGRAVGIAAQRDAIALAFDTGETLRAARVLVAAGVGSRTLMRSAGHDAPLIAERGYHIEGPCHGWEALPPVVFEDRSMIVSRFGARLRAASFVEFARRDAPPDPGKWDRLRRHVAELGLPVGDTQPWMGCRPTLPDYLPAIGISRRMPGLSYAFGHQHLGLTLAPTTAELVTALLTGSAPRCDLTPFDIERFAGSRK